VVVSDREDRRARGAQGAGQTPAHVVWHDLECGGYRADLALWRELAQRSGGRVLDVGAGAGRVTLDLARADHAVTALDLDATLLAALSERAVELDRHDFGSCLVPMQTIQLLGGAAGRVAFLQRARQHLRPDGVIACAILARLEPFDSTAGAPGPVAERARVGGLLYLSRATRVSELAETVEIVRERRVIDDRPVASAGARETTSQATGAPERDLIELDRLSARDLERDARVAGLRPLQRHEVPATDEHVGSVVVVLGA
jgi:SAM-dependent methyltransferase